MPYLISSLVFLIAALTILLTSFDGSSNKIIKELEFTKVMFLSIDEYVNTYIKIGKDLSAISFEVLSDSKILLESSTVVGLKNKAILSFKANEIKWQIIPNKDNYSSYELLVDLRANKIFMSKPGFSESFLGRKYCEELFFGDFNQKSNSYDETLKVFNSDGTKKDGLFSCTIYK